MILLYDAHNLYIRKVHSYVLTLQDNVLHNIRGVLTNLDIEK